MYGVYIDGVYRELVEYNCNAHKNWLFLGCTIHVMYNIEWL